MDDEAVSRETAAAEIRAEAGRQAVILVFGVAGAALMWWLQRAAASPDAARTAKMRAAKVTERAAALTAGNCWRLAEAARRAYERECA